VNTSGRLSGTRRGTGSIIGAVFLLLILLSGLTAYILTVRTQVVYRSTQEEMDQLERYQGQEEITFQEVSLTGDRRLNITARNTGPNTVHLIWLGVLDETVTPPIQRFSELDLYLKPYETATNISTDDVTILEGHNYTILLVTELGSVFTYTYPPEEAGGARVRIIARNCTVSYSPSGWSLLNSTGYVSGSTSSLVEDDGDYLIFRSHYTGTRRTQYRYVDQIPEPSVDPPTYGAHSNFTAQRSGPDSVYDTLTEESVPGTGNITLIDGESFEDIWPPAGWSETGQWNKESDEAYDGTYSADFDGLGSGRSGDLDTPELDCSDAVAIYIEFWYRDNNLDADDLLLQYYDGTTWNTIADLGSTTQENQWLHYREKITDSRYFVSNFKVRWSAVTIRTGEHAWIDYVTIKKEVETSNYNLDLEVQWTDVDFDEENEELCIYCGTMGSEDLGVDVWYNSTWQSLLTDLNPGWNNVSVAPYLDSPNFTIRFIGGTETGDTTQDSWEIDAALLHLWSEVEEYTVEVEFTGSSNLEDWTELVWWVESCWNISGVDVTIQLYDYALGDYPTGGDGYTSYTSSGTPNTDELRLGNITSNASRFRNATSGEWRVRIRGVKETGTPFLLKVDLIGLQTTYSFSGGTLPYGGWGWYTLRAEDPDGAPIPYAYASVYADGENVLLRNASNGEAMENPAWVRLDSNGEFQLEVSSRSPGGDEFTLYIVVGSLVGERRITQEGST